MADTPFHIQGHELFWENLYMEHKHPSATEALYIDMPPDNSKH